MEVLLKPLITEKTSNLSEENKYAFLVNVKANKVEIKKAVEEMYGVGVITVNTSINLGKKKNRFTKAGMISGRKSTTKKAIVKVADGDMIDFYSNI